jgi:hypothetical protein
MTLVPGPELASRFRMGSTSPKSVVFGIDRGGPTPLGILVRAYYLSSYCSIALQQLRSGSTSDKGNCSAAYRQALSADKHHPASDDYLLESSTWNPPQPTLQPVLRQRAVEQSVVAMSRKLARTAEEGE